MEFRAKVNEKRHCCTFSIPLRLCAFAGDTFRAYAFADG